MIDAMRIRTLFAIRKKLSLKLLKSKFVSILSY